MDKLVYDFRNELNERKRSRIFTKIRSVYLPKIKAIASTYQDRYTDELIAYYDYQLLLHVNRYTGINKQGKYCSAKSFLYWAVRKAESTLNEKVISRDKKYDSLDVIYNEPNPYGESTFGNVQGENHPLVDLIIDFDPED